MARRREAQRGVEALADLFEALEARREVRTCRANLQRRARREQEPTTNGWQDEGQIEDEATSRNASIRQMLTRRRDPDN